MEKVVKTNVAQVSHGKTKGIIGKGSNVVDFMEQWEQDGLDALGWWILFGVATIEVGKAVIKFAELV